MPAREEFDTPHESTKKVGHREYCWNNRTPHADGYWTQVRVYRPDGSFTMGSEFVKDRMSKECGQPGHGIAPAPGCVGCAELKEYK